MFCTRHTISLREKFVIFFLFLLLDKEVNKKKLLKGGLKQTCSNLKPNQNFLTKPEVNFMHIHPRWILSKQKNFIVFLFLKFFPTPSQFDSHNRKGKKLPETGEILCACKVIFLREMELSHEHFHLFKRNNVLLRKKEKQTSVIKGTLSISQSYL